VIELIKIAVILSIVRPFGLVLAGLTFGKKYSTAEIVERTIDSVITIAVFTFVLIIVHPAFK